VQLDSLDRGRDLPAIDVRHAQIGDHQVERLLTVARLAERLDAGLAAFGRHDRMSVLFEHTPAGLQHERIIIDQQVIVVSACYAGKFIEPLRDDNTIIIAAAAADRTSFGRSDDRDLTYFGEAFYRDALPAASDLKAAFQKASAEIATRERAEGKTASKPQAQFGRALVAHLQSTFPGT
jgi:hypothetical protein